MEKPQRIIHFNSNPLIFLQAKGLVEAKAGKLPLDGQWYWDKKLFYIVEMRVLIPWDVLLLMFVQMMPKNQIAICLVILMLNQLLEFQVKIYFVYHMSTTNHETLTYNLFLSNFAKGLQKCFVSKINSYTVIFCQFRT